MNNTQYPQSYNYTSTSPVNKTLTSPSFKSFSSPLKTMKKKNVNRKLRIYGQDDDYEQKQYYEEREFTQKYKRDFFIKRLYKFTLASFFDMTEFIIHFFKFAYDYLLCCRFICFILRTDQETQRRKLIERKNQINKTNLSTSNLSCPSSSSTYSTSILNQEDISSFSDEINTSLLSSDNQSFDCIQNSMRMYDDHPNNLVLDLDETLIHCDDRMLNEDAYQIQVQFQDSIRNFYLHQRSHLQEFLEQCAQNYNIYIYTASTRQYAEEVVRHIDPRCIIKKIYCRSSCFFDGKQFNKSLRTLGIDLNRTVMIDNSQPIVNNNVENALKIKDYIFDKNDRELLKFSNILNKMCQTTGSFKDMILNYES